MNILEEYIAASGLLHDTDLPQNADVKQSYCGSRTRYRSYTAAKARKGKETV